VKILRPSAGVRHEAGFDEDGGHDGVAQDGEAGAANAPIHDGEVAHEGFLHLVGEEHVLIVVAIARE